jgi:poly-gamma-glutamate synthesis protein (capsule biosynthesis protein)
MRAASVLALVVALALGGEPALAADEPFDGSVSRLNRATRELMTGSSWREGCPVDLEDLRLVRVTFLGFDGLAHGGRLVVHRRWAGELLWVFERLYARSFPLRRVHLVDRYGADDDLSMRHDNTSAFNCRTIGGTDEWSQHAYGRAIDINPVENPYVEGTHVSPRRGRAYLDRSAVRPGMIVKRDAVWRAFRRIGWEWGGTWRSARDYQHFSANGR